MFAVEVQDAQGRVLPITDNEVTFSVSGKGRLIGTGNGDPTNQEPDKGPARKAFCGLCMALVQSNKADGKITVEAASPWLAAASVTIAAKPVTLRPQVAVWEREVPAGAGITGLWRPIPNASGAASQFAALAGDDNSVYSLRQNGANLEGDVEGAGGGFFGGGDAGVKIEEGKVDGNSVSFKAGASSYSGTIKNDRIELQRTVAPRFPMTRPAEPTGPQPAIGPPPDGSDPSRNPNMRQPSAVPLVLHRVQR